VKGLAVDAQATPGQSTSSDRWAWIIGDSITEGISAGPRGADNLACWSYFVGQALQFSGYEYGIFACGYSGWLRPGDSEGDVPAFYFVSQGQYDETRSRWDKLDAKTSLLDSEGKLSGYGKVHQEPSVIILNLGTNDGIKNVPVDDLKQSIAGAFGALRGAAPHAKIFVVVPFGQFEADILKTEVQNANSSHPDVPAISVIDLGNDVARALVTKGYWGGLHPDIRGHAVLAARILAKLLPELPSESPAK
jgi:GDSL-like Lipase/Acylhydrolase family